MALLCRRAHPRSLGPFGRTLLGLLLGLGAVDAGAQTWTFRPVFTLSYGYDSNATYTPGGAIPEEATPEDTFGGLGLRAPLTGHLSQRTTLSANYAANGEWYQDLEGLNKFPSRQNASLAWDYANGDATTFGLGVGYAENRRAEEVFPEAGIAYVRGKTENVTGNADFARRVGEFTHLTLAYTYGRPFYEPIDGVKRTADSHSGTASLGRDLHRGSTLSIRYRYQLYERSDAPRDQSHVVGLAFTRTFGKSTTLNLFGGARFAAGEVRPDASVALGHAWRSSQLNAIYTKTRYYIPTTGGFSDNDSAGLTYSVGQRRFRLSLSVGYARNRFEEEVDVLGFGRDIESYRGAVDTVYMVKRWLGIGANYQYNQQHSLNTNFDDRSRHLAQAGLVIAPWNAKEAQGLR